MSARGELPSGYTDKEEKLYCVKFYFPIFLWHSAPHSQGCECTVVSFGREGGGIVCVRRVKAQALVRPIQNNLRIARVV
jgi:hypothetical protein